MLSRTFHSNMSRKRVMCLSSKSVFEIRSTILGTKLEVVRDAYEVCHYLDGAEKEACYIVFGLDAKNVEKYLPVVEEFERMYDKKYTKFQDLYNLDSEQSPTIVQIGPFKFTIKND